MGKLGIAEGEGRVGPEVGIGVAFRLREGEIEGPLVSGDGVVAEEEYGRIVLFCALGEVEGGFLEEESVGDDEVGLGESGGDGGRGCKSVGVGTFGDDSLE